MGSKIAAVIIMLFVLASCASRRPRTTLDMLTANLWLQAGHEKDGIEVWDFSPDSIRHLNYENGKFRKNKVRSVYYLSDTPDEVFDQSKIGKAHNGRYVIRKPISTTSSGKTMDLAKPLVDEILWQTDSTYAFRMLYSPQTWVLSSRKDTSYICSHIDSPAKPRQTTKDSLMFNVWMDDRGWSFMEFGTDTLKFFRAERKGNPKRKHTLDALYYLSDTPDEVFDQSKVGKQQNGKYIICRNVYPTPLGFVGAADYVYITEIVALSDYHIVDKSHSDPFESTALKKKGKFHECRLRLYGMP